MTKEEVVNIANTANIILVINEMMKQIEKGELEPWNPVNIVVDAIGKANVQDGLFRYLDTLKCKLKEVVALL